MDFSLDDYRIFDAVVREKSFSAAADSLFITQPAVSQAVRRMEEALGARLFVRTPRGAALTMEGETLSGYVSSALSLLKTGEQRLKSLAELSSGALRIGASDTLSKWFLAPVTERFHRLYPGVAISMTNRTSTDILGLLSGGQIDIGYVNLPIAAPGMITLTCRSVRDIFIAGERFSALKGRVLELSELAAQPMIMLERAANSRRWVDRFFLSNGIATKAAIELGAHDLIADYVRIGLGVGCVIKEFSREAIERGGIFELALKTPVPARSIGVCYPESIELSPAARKFIDMSREQE